MAAEIDTEAIAEEIIRFHRRARREAQDQRLRASHPIIAAGR